jgi:hypothetical protein
MWGEGKETSIEMIPPSITLWNGGLTLNEALLTSSLVSWQLMRTGSPTFSHTCPLLVLFKSKYAFDLRTMSYCRIIIINSIWSATCSLCNYGALVPAMFTDDEWLEHKVCFAGRLKYSLCTLWVIDHALYLSVNCHLSTCRVVHQKCLKYTFLAVETNDNVDSNNLSCTALLGSTPAKLAGRALLRWKISRNTPSFVGASLCGALGVLDSYEWLVGELKCVTS